MKTNYPKHALWTGLAFVALMIAAHVALGAGKGLGPKAADNLYAFSEQTTPWTPHVAAPPSESAAIVRAAAQEPGLLIDANGGMDRFYQALMDNEQQKRDRPVRILHYGDSPTTADLITGDARELLQKRWGDAGHGFVLAAKPWAWYDHRGVDVSGEGWTIDTAVGGHREGEYGYGGAVFDGQAGAHSRWKLADATHATIEVEYMQQPAGGELALTADGAEIGRVSTEGSERKAGFASIELPRGAHTIEMRVETGAVRLFGVTLNKGAHGLSYDSLGLNGATTTVVARMLNASLWAAELAHRQPDLVILNYGTNESGFASYVEKLYEPELRLAIERVKKAAPQASILVMSPMDRGDRAGGAVQTMATIPKIIAIQKRVAAETGCGFFNTYEAMGGEGSMARWNASSPKMVAADLIHPTPKGARIVAEAFISQLNGGYMRYKLRWMREQQKALAKK